MKKILLMLLLCAPLLYMGCKAEPEWVNLIAQQEQEKGQEEEQEEADSEFKWANLADSCTTVLINQFMNKPKGTFWATPANESNNSGNIYWQQAHAMDVVIYSYQRIKDKNPSLADTYENYFKLWYDNKANNYDKGDTKYGTTGFGNRFTDDMCWICLTLIRLSEATGDDTYINMAKTVYDTQIITRAWEDEKGKGLPWKELSVDKTRNACTNAPGCLVAAKLYLKFQDAKYLTDAKILCAYVNANILKSDYRVGEPPLTYTQGTFGEACRQLYHITQEQSYMAIAEQVISYAFTSTRCTNKGFLRDEGTDMNQSIFKAVLIPYAVNLVLDDAASGTVRNTLTLKLQDNAEALRKNMDRTQWPAMYCNYYWGSSFNSANIASMGAQASGASLMEGVARLEAAQAK